MKIEVAKIDLENALAVAGIVVTSEKDLSSHYLFRARDGKIEVLTYAKRLFARAPLVCTLDGGDGAFTVEGWRLDRWLSGVGDGVLKLTSNGKGEVEASGPRSKVRFRSLDPSKFPHWDDLMKTAVTQGTVNPAPLLEALGVSKWFVSADDTYKPEFCQIEVVNGVMWATDKQALSSVEIPTLPDLNVRIPGKDVGQIVRFLKDKGTKGAIEIKSSERAAADGGGANCTLHREDGSYLGITRPEFPYPKLNVDRDQEFKVSMTLDRGEFSTAVDVLRASAPKGHERVGFNYDVDSKVLSLSMTSEAGGEDTFPLEKASVIGGDDFVSFQVDYPYIKGLGSVFDLDQIEFGVEKRGEGGYIAFRTQGVEDDSNRYCSVIVWRN